MSNGDADSKGGLESESVKPVNGNPAQADSKNGGNQTGSSLLNVLADVALTKEKKPGKSKNGYGGAVKGGEAVDGAATAIGSDGESDLPSDEEEGGEHFSSLRVNCSSAPHPRLAQPKILNKIQRLSLNDNEWKH